MVPMVPVCSDMTLQATPPPPSPSWRVLVSLRLLHHRLGAGSTAASLSASALAPWYHVVSGATETLSPTNEAKVRASWRAVAEAVAREVEAGTKRCDEVRERWQKDEFKRDGGGGAGAGNDERSDLLASLQMVRTVWTEEERIARAVLAAPVTTR